MTWRRVLAVALVAGALGCGGDDGITVTGGAVTGLRFTVQPSSTAAGTVFAVTVELITSNGQRAATATDVVQLSIGGGASISGTTSIAAVAGVASFTGLTVTRAGTGYQISASALGFTASSSAFTITPGTVSAAQSTVALTPTTVTVNVPVSATFTFRDNHGNAMASVPVSFTSTLAGSSFTPPSGTTDVDGRVTTTFLATAAGNAILRITVNGVQFDFATPFVVGAGS